MKAPRLEWQDEYFAVSIGESAVGNVRAYIDNQEARHKKKTFAEEYDEFMRKYGFAALGQKQQVLSLLFSLL